MDLHSGHRDRIRERFLKEGLDSFSDVQVLEFLLFYCIARADTNPLAHALLERFGSLSQVMEAPVTELMKVKGVGANTAIFLKLIPQAGRFYQTDRNSNVRVLSTLESCAEYLLPYFIGKHVETVYLLCLDAKCKLLGCFKITEGNVNSAGISVRKVVEQALAANASTVVLAHNHPGGVAVPSREDIQTTMQLASALQAVDVQLADHVVVADDDYVSMVQSGYRFPESRG